MEGRGVVSSGAAARPGRGDAARGAAARGGERRVEALRRGLSAAAGAWAAVRSLHTVLLRTAENHIK